jgi:hypothetical protein
MWKLTYLKNALLFLIIYLPCLLPYRILDPDLGALNASETGSPAYFVPYAPGFVGRVQDPDNPRRFRVNPGNQFSLAQPNIFRGVLPRQECPGMITVAVNATDSARASTLYYCSREEAGYCDRRSGACFCYEGYQGLDCSACRPTHFRNKDSGLCEKKALCPNDCSGGGECDSKTGMCKCRYGRKGVDCSLHYCRLLHRWCQSCNKESCKACDPGYYVHPETKACVTCAVFDPRCVDCNERGCNTCADPLLSSVRRSGRRRRDPPLPWDEDSRVLSTTIPFGSQSPSSFNDAEVFFLVTDVGAAATHGVRKGAFSPATACFSGAGLSKRLSIPDATSNSSDLPQLHITAAVIYSADLSSDGAAGHVRRYHLDCSPLAYADSYYGFGATALDIEGPVEGAVFGSRLSPVAYFPGALDADDGSSLVQVYGEKLRMSRIVDAHADIQQGIPYWRWGSKIMVDGSGIDQIRWQDYKGYKIDSIRGDLNTNDSAILDVKGGYEGGGPHIVYRGGRMDLNDTVYLGFNYSLPMYFYTRRLMEDRKAKGLMVDYPADISDNGPEDDGGFIEEEEEEEEVDDTVDSTWSMIKPSPSPSPTPSPSSFPFPFSHENRRERSKRRNRRRLYTDEQKHRFGGQPGDVLLPDNSPNNLLPLTLSTAADELTARSSDPESARRLPPLPLLNASAMACEQGIDGDDSWTCSHVRQSHVVCGHPGTIFFSSPTYTVLESDKYVAITVRRSGGGLGRVSVRISLEHVSTDDSDVSLRAQYTGANELVFEEGVVSLTFRVSIHDDRLPEPADNLASTGKRFSKWAPLPRWTPSSPPVLSSAEQAGLNAAFNGSSDLFAESRVVDGPTSLAPSTTAEVHALGLAQGGIIALSHLPAGYLLRKKGRLNSSATPDGVDGEGFTANSSKKEDLEVGQDGKYTAYFAAMAQLRTPDGKAFANWPRGSAYTRPLGEAGIYLDSPKLFNSTTSVPVDAFPGTGSRSWTARLSPHETFLLKLHSPCCGAHLRAGNGAITTVAIIDDDTFRVHPGSCAGDSRTSPLLTAPSTTILLGALARGNTGPTLVIDTSDDKSGPLTSIQPTYAKVGRETTVSIISRDGAGFYVNSSRFAALHLDAVNAPDRIPVSILGKERFVVSLRTAPNAALVWLENVVRKLINKALLSRFTRKQQQETGSSHETLRNDGDEDDESKKLSWSSQPLIYTDEEVEEEEDENREDDLTRTNGHSSVYADKIFNEGDQLDKGTQKKYYLASAIAQWVQRSPSSSSSSSSSSLPLSVLRATPHELGAALSILLHDDKRGPILNPQEVEDDIEGRFIDEWWKEIGLRINTLSFDTEAVGESPSFTGTLAGNGGSNAGSVIAEASSYWPAGQNSNGDVISAAEAKTRAAASSIQPAHVYAATLVPTRAGLSEVWVQHANPGGLKGSYYNNDRFSGSPLLQRVDAGINFTWGLGPLFEVSKCAPCGGNGDEGLNGGTLSDEKEDSWGVSQPGRCSIQGAGASDFALNISAATDGIFGEEENIRYSEHSFSAMKRQGSNRSSISGSDNDVDPLSSSLQAQTEHMLQGKGRNKRGGDLSGCSTGSFADHVSIRWSGKLGLPEGYESGLYQLVLFADDHVRLFLDGSLLVDAWGEGRSSSSSSNSDLGSRSGASVSASTGDHGASLPVDDSDDNPLVDVKRLGRFDLNPSSLEFPSLADPLLDSSYELFIQRRTERKDGRNNSSTFIDEIEHILPDQTSSKVPLPAAGKRTTVCSFARLDGGSSSLLKEQTAPQDIDMACVDASIPSAVPLTSRDRIWTDPADQMEGHIKYSRAYSSFREMQALLAAQRATGALNIADQAWVGLKTTVALSVGRLHDLVIEYRDVSGWATCRLAWITPAMTRAAATAAGASNATNSTTNLFGVVPVAVPQEALYSVRHIGGSPFLTYVEPGDLWADGAIVNADSDMRDGGAPDLADTLPSAFNADNNIFSNKSRGDTTGFSSHDMPSALGGLVHTAGTALTHGTTTDGSGLSVAIAGEDARFIIRPRDIYGNARAALAKRDSFIVQFTQLYLDPTLQVIVNYTENDSCNHSSNSRSSSHNENSIPISGLGTLSRHAIRVIPRLLVSSAASAVDSASLGGSRFDLRDGVETSRQGFHSNSTFGKNSSLFPSRSLLFGSAIYNSTSGFVDAEWRPSASGVCLLSVLARVDHRIFAHVTGSPHVATVVSNHPSSRTSVVWGQGVDINGGGAIAGTPYSLVIQPRDEWNNPILVRTESKSMQNGVIVVEDLTKLPEETRVNVRAYYATKEKNVSVKAKTIAVLIPLFSSGKWNQSTVQVSGSRFEFQIDEGMVNIDESISSTLLNNSIFNDTLLSEPGGYKKSIEAIRGGLRILVFVSVWTPVISGPYLVSATYSMIKESISASPYPVVVPPGPSSFQMSTLTLTSDQRLVLDKEVTSMSRSSSSSFSPLLKIPYLSTPEPAQFRLTIRDSFNNLRVGTNFLWSQGTRFNLPLQGKNGTWRTSTADPVSSTLPLDLIDPISDALTAWVEFPVWHAMLREGDLPQVRTRNATIKYDGCCNATYSIKSPCGGLLCRLSVLLRGKHVSGSPFSYKRDAYEATATTSNVFGSGLVTSTVGSEANVFLQLRDLDGNIARGTNVSALIAANRVKLVAKRLGGVQVDVYESSFASNEYTFYSRVGNETLFRKNVPLRLVGMKDFLYQSARGVNVQSALVRVTADDDHILERVLTSVKVDETWPETALSIIPTTPDTPVFIWNKNDKISLTKNWSFFPNEAKGQGVLFKSIMSGQNNDEVEKGLGNLPFYLRAKGTSSSLFDSTVASDDIDSSWRNDSTLSLSLSSSLLLSDDGIQVSYSPYLSSDSEGLLRLSWTPTRSGVYEIIVTLDGNVIQGESGDLNSSNTNTSDYNISKNIDIQMLLRNTSSISTALPLSFHASSSTLSGSILRDKGALAGVMNGFSIVARDMFSNRCGRRGSELIDSSNKARLVSGGLISARLRPIRDSLGRNIAANVSDSERWTIPLTFNNVDGAPGVYSTLFEPRVSGVSAIDVVTPRPLVGLIAEYESMYSGNVVSRFEPGINMIVDGQKAALLSNTVNSSNSTEDGTEDNEDESLRTIFSQAGWRSSWSGFFRPIFPNSLDEEIAVPILSSVDEFNEKEKMANTENVELVTFIVKTSGGRSRLLLRAINASSDGETSGRDDWIDLSSNATVDGIGANEALEGVKVLHLGHVERLTKELRHFSDGMRTSSSSWLTLVDTDLGIGTIVSSGRVSTWTSTVPLRQMRFYGLFASFDTTPIVDGNGNGNGNTKKIIPCTGGNICSFSVRILSSSLSLQNLNASTSSTVKNEEEKSSTQLMKNTTLYGPSLSQALPSLPLAFLFPPLLDHVGSSPIVFQVATNLAYAPSTSVEWIAQKFNFDSNSHNATTDANMSLFDVDVVYFSNHEVSFILTIFDALGNIRSEEAKDDKVILWCVKSNDDGSDIDEPVYSSLDFKTSFIGQGRILVRFTPFSVGTFRLLVAINPPIKRNDTSYREYEKIVLKADALAGPTARLNNAVSIDTGKNRRLHETLAALKNARVPGGDKIKLERAFFIMKLLPGIASDDLRENSFVYGPNVSLATAGEEGTFFVQLVDKGGNNASGRTDLLVETSLAWRSGIAGQRVKFLTQGPRFVSMYVSPVSTSAGLYLIRYIAEVSGIYDCSIFIDGSLTESSPFELRIIPARPVSYTSFISAFPPSVAVYDDANRLSFNARLSVGGITDSLLNMSLLFPIIATVNDRTKTAFTGNFAVTDEGSVERDQRRRIPGTGSVVATKKQAPTPIRNVIQVGEAIILSGVQNGGKVVTAKVVLKDSYSNVVSELKSTSLWVELRRGVSAAVGKTASVRGYTRFDTDEGVIIITVSIPPFDDVGSEDGNERLKEALSGSDSVVTGEYWLDVLLLEPTESEGDSSMNADSFFPLTLTGKNYSRYHGLSIVLSGGDTVLIDPQPFSHTSLWAEDALIGSFSVEWNGFLRSVVTGRVSFLLVCDGPCSLFLDRKHVADVTEESFFNEDIDEISERSLLMKSIGLNDSLINTCRISKLGFFNLRMDESYFLSLAFKKRESLSGGTGGSSSSHKLDQGIVRLFWAWKDVHAEMIVPEVITDSSESLKEVELTSLYWSGQHVKGSPVAVRVIA